MNRKKETGRLELLAADALSIVAKVTKSPSPERQGKRTKATFQKESTGGKILGGLRPEN